MSKLLPARVAHLRDRLAEAFFAGTAARQKLFLDLARLVEDLERHFASVHLRATQELYSPYDPDCETVPPAPISPSDEVQTERLFESTSVAFVAANFEPLPRERFESAHEVVGLEGAKLDLGLEEIERFAVFVRGQGHKALSLRPAKNWFRRVELDVPTHVRAAIVIRTKREPHVQLRLYKDIAESDVHLLLPTVRLRMRTLDKLTLSSSGGAAAISVVKMVALVAAWVAHERPLPVQVLVVLVAVVLLLGIYGGKTLLDYTKIKASYLTLLAEHLHALTLATNRSVLTHLVELVAEEETKEVLLAYALLAEAGASGLTPEALGVKAKEWLRASYACEVEFDVPDALQKLSELSLLVPGSEGLRSEGVRVVAVEEAVRRLDGIWDELYTPDARAEGDGAHVGI